MTYHPETKEQRHAHAQPAAAWVHEVLEPDQLSTARQRFGLRIFGRWTMILLWGLRIYVLLMVLLIGVQIWNAFHAAH